jgi:ubiquinone/menaquinone biosynthesis C-methylase UbiE
MLTFPKNPWELQMNEKEKYLNIYQTPQGVQSQADVIPGHMGGGYGRICWGENMLETLKRWNVSSLLDVGCGYGNFCDAAALFIPKVYGLDIASVATGNVIDNPEITYFDGEAKHLPLPNNAVEWITSFDCLEHCLETEIDDILKEFNRVARNGFVLSVSYEPCEMDGMPLHMTVKPESWWVKKLLKYGQVSKHEQAPITGAPYLICRKPVEKTLICYCAGSIGTRLGAIACADRIARRTNRRLTLLWLSSDPLCRIRFSSLFVNPIPRISDEELLNLPSCKVYAQIKEVADQAIISGGKALRGAVKKWGSSELETLSIDDSEDNIIIYDPSSKIPFENDDNENLLERLSPTIPIQNRIQEFTARFQINKKIMGVHARGTDFGIHADAYAQQIQKAITHNPNQRFFVCSDERAYEQSLKAQFPEQVIVRTKSAWMQKRDASLPWALGNVDTSVASVTDALIDLYLLAQTQFTIYHESSAFAKIGSLLSQKYNLRPAENVAQPHPTYSGHCQLGQYHDKVYPHNKTRMAPKAGFSGHTPTTEAQHTIYYFCPDSQASSAGIRRLHRHVSVLHKAGFPVFLLLEKKGLDDANKPSVPVAYLDHIENDESAIFVIPEGMPRIMRCLKDHPGRRFAIALSWCYVYSTLPDGLDWRHMNIERVMAFSPVIGRMIHWSMDLPVYQLASSIDHQLYYYPAEEKQNQISYIKRKAEHVQKLQTLLAARNPDYIRKIKWVGLDGLSQQAYAAQIRRSAIFLTTSLAEGFPIACLEAMAAGTIVSGYDAVGGKKTLCPDGSDQNCILSSNGDYVSLAYRLDPLLDDLIENRMDRWQPMITRGRQTALQVNAHSEAESLIAFWKPLVYGHMDTGQTHATGILNWAALRPTPVTQHQCSQPSEN